MDCGGVAKHFSVDEDDDGFIDYAHMEQNEVRSIIASKLGLKHKFSTLAT
jgi:hypothetical protein